MSKGAKKYVFKTKGGVQITMVCGSQDHAVETLASLVKSVSDFPHLRIIKV